MEKNSAEILRNNSESYFLVPFYYSGKKVFEKRLGVNWRKEGSNNHWFLVKHIDTFDKGKDDERIATYFTLREENYSHYNLPARDTDITVASDLIVGEDKLPEHFTMRITQVKILYFNTGFGFLIYQIDHQEDELGTIVDKSFALLRSLVPERRSGKGVRFTALLPCQNESDKLTECEINLMKITNHLLEVDENNKYLELFPTSCKNQCYIYHRIQLGKPISDEELERHLLYLRKGFHTSFHVPEKEEDHLFDFAWKQNSNQYWGGSMKGVASISYCIPGENNYFVKVQYSHYVRNDYFLLYMILLHQRQVLLYYNYIAVKNQSRMKKMEKIKKELIRFRINFAYKAVSDETSYQRFYNGMYECLSLECLNSDIQDVIDRVTEYQDFSNEKSMNFVLALIAIFSVISAFADAIGFADRMMEGIVLSGPHWAAIISISVIMIAVIITIIKRVFRK
jgi:uncharacterized membrane protein (DUF485 family)